DYVMQWLVSTVGTRMVVDAYQYDPTGHRARNHECGAEGLAGLIDDGNIKLAVVQAVVSARHADAGGRMDMPRSEHPAGGGLAAFARRQQFAPALRGTAVGTGFRVFRIQRCNQVLMPHRFQAAVWHALGATVAHALIDQPRRLLQEIAEELVHRHMSGCGKKNSGPRLGALRWKQREHPLDERGGLAGTRRPPDGHDIGVFMKQALNGL